MDKIEKNENSPIATEGGWGVFLILELLYIKNRRVPYSAKSYFSKS